MPANSNNASPPITIPTIAPVFRLEEDEVVVPLFEDEDVELDWVGELPLYVAVRGWFSMLVAWCTDAVVARVDAYDCTDPAVFVGAEPPAIWVA